VVRADISPRKDNGMSSWMQVRVAEQEKPEFERGESEVDQTNFALGSKWFGRLQTPLFRIRVFLVQLHELASKMTFHCLYEEICLP
jgi:hypothetical protein